jgi:sulfur-oxidizing protein SoxY
MTTRRSPLCLSAILAISIAALLATSPARAEDDPWLALRSDLFAQRPISEDPGKFELEAPGRAEDAAIVPVTIKIPASMGTIKSLTIVVDKNPAPVAATFTFGPAAGSGDRMIETRLRFDAYSTLRAIAETADGSLFMTTRFVKAAGGCSAPSLKDADEAMANLGKLQVRSLAAVDTDPSSRIGHVMVRHPNYSGMQMNQETGYYIPAKYVTQMDVTRGGERVFRLDAGISLSADPNIRFTFASSTDNRIAVSASDSDGSVFSGQSVASGS